MKYLEIRIGAAALAGGMLWSLSFLIWGLYGYFSGYSPESYDLVADWYIGFAPTIAGAFIGALWAFADGFLGGAIFAWIYNKLLPKSQDSNESKPIEQENKTEASIVSFQDNPEEGLPKSY